MNLRLVAWGVLLQPENFSFFRSEFGSGSFLDLNQRIFVVDQDYRLGIVYNKSDFAVRQNKNFTCTFVRIERYPFLKTTILSIIH